jgi:hypothetical protein
MSTAQLVRAMKDEDYRLSLPEGSFVHPSGNSASELYVTGSDNAGKISDGNCYSTCQHLCSSF